jgi:non-ribosomal peptide synthase protein (TIGR01720 family)
MERLMAEAHESLDLEKGPLARFLWLDFGQAQSGLLLIVIHHWAVDGVSWRVILEDLHHTYELARSGSLPSLPPKTASFITWGRHLAEYAGSEELARELVYWQRLVGQACPAFPLEGAGDNLESSAKTYSAALSETETQALLERVPGTFGTEINHVLLTALTRAFERVTGSQNLLVAMEGHGRESLFPGVDISRTVGWFTTIFPLALSLKPEVEPVAALRSIKEQVNRLPNRGIGYGILRYLNTDSKIAETMTNIPRPSVRFNYLGQFNTLSKPDSWFRVADEHAGATRHAREYRCYQLDVGALVAEGRLRLNITYSEALNREKTIKAFAERYLDMLRALIAAAAERSAGAAAPGVDALTMDQEEIEDIFEEIGG